MVNREMKRYELDAPTSESPSILPGEFYRARVRIDFPGEDQLSACGELIYTNEQGILIDDELLGKPALYQWTQLKRVYPWPRKAEKGGVR